MKASSKPVILISPSVAAAGSEFADQSISLSDAYLRAVAEAGGVPLVMSPSASPAMARAYVAMAQGIVLSGGEDIEPALYDNDLPENLRRKVVVTPDGGRRDLFELQLVNEVFRQRKPLLAICRGHQLLNVALGGSLLVDIPSQVPEALQHRRMDKRCEVVHEVRLTADSLLAKIAGTQRLGVNSTHHQAVGQVAEPLCVAGQSPDGIIEGLELKPEARGLLPFLVSVQFHPERLTQDHREHRGIFCEFMRACARGSH